MQLMLQLYHLWNALKESGLLQFLACCNFTELVLARYLDQIEGDYESVVCVCILFNLIVR